MTSINKTSGIIFSITLIIIAGIIYFFTLPTLNSYRQSKDQIAQTQAKLDQVKKEVSLYTSLRDKEPDIKLYGEKTQGLIPKDPNLEYFLIDLEALIAQSSVPQAEFDFASLSSSSQTANNPSVIQGIRNFQLTITGDSSLPNIINLINKLKTMSRLTEITAIDLNTSNNKENNINFTITGNIFSNKNNDTQTSRNPQKILDEAVAKITQYQSYGKDIEIQKEAGFGRTNPFNSY